MRDGPASKGRRSAEHRIISGGVCDRAAPIPGVTPPADQNSFLHEVAALVDSIAAHLDVKLL